MGEQREAGERLCVVLWCLVLSRVVLCCCCFVVEWWFVVLAKLVVLMLSYVA